MREFKEIDGKNFSFTSCAICTSKCCDGLQGFVYAQITLEDFEEVSKYFPIGFILDSEQFLLPVVLLTNGKNFCKYFHDFDCSIYDQRPSVCKAYPLSPYYENKIHIDKFCPAVEENYNMDTNNKYEGDFIVKNGVVQDKYFHEILDNYEEKFIKTGLHFKDVNKEKIELLCEIHRKKIYKLNEKVDDKFFNLHQLSLKKFDYYYKC